MIRASSRHHKSIGQIISSKNAWEGLNSGEGVAEGTGHFFNGSSCQFKGRYGKLQPRIGAPLSFGNHQSAFKRFRRQSDDDGLGGAVCHMKGDRLTSVSYHADMDGMISCRDPFNHKPPVTVGGVTKSCPFKNDVGISQRFARNHINNAPCHGLSLEWDEQQKHQCQKYAFLHFLEFMPISQLRAHDEKVASSKILKFRRLKLHQTRHGNALLGCLKFHLKG